MLDIYVRDGNYADHLLETIEAAVQNNQVRKQWTLKADGKFLAICGAKTKKGLYSLPFFFFKAAVGELAGQSGPFYIHSDVEIQLNDKDGKPVENKKFTARLASGETRHGTADGSGKARLKDIAPGNVQIDLDS